MIQLKPAERIAYSVQGSQKWGYYVCLATTDHTLPLYTSGDAPFDWASPEDARKAAVEALRSLVDRIERGET